MIKDLLTIEEITKLKENVKLAFIGETLTDSIHTRDDEQALLEALKNDFFKKTYREHLENLTNDLYQKYISIKKLLIE